MNTTMGFSGAAGHVKSAARHFKDWAQLKSYVQKQKAQKTGIQVAVSAIFGTFLLIWAEVAAYLALAASMKPYFAALIVLGINLAIVGGVNLFITAWKKRVRHYENIGSMPELERDKRLRERREELSAPDAVLRAERNRHEGRHELMVAKNELIDSANGFVQEKIVVPANRFIVEPVSRHRMPLAFVSSFAVGLLVARALVPRAKRSSDYRLYEFETLPFERPDLESLIEERTRRVG